MTLYRYVLSPLVIALLIASRLWRILLGRETMGDLRERLAKTPIPELGDVPVLWLHGASVGELAGAKPLVDTLLARDPDLCLIVTANTVTGRERAESWQHNRVFARLAPFDSRASVERFLDCWQPHGLIQLEKELWPNRMVLAYERGIAVMQAAALISERSAAKWKKLPGLAAEMMSALDLVAAQDAETEIRLVSLGLPPKLLGRRLNLKAAVKMSEPDPQLLAELSDLLPRERLFLAASTHAGEEEVVLNAFRQASDFEPGLKLVIAPRHPERGDEVARLIQKAGFQMARRSLGELPSAETEVYLADTLGEMGLWYRLAPACFLGGSLVNKGGHTPFEPVQLGCALLHGPYVGNNAEAYDHLHHLRGTQEVQDAASLGAEMLRLLADGLGRQTMTERARGILDEGGADRGGIDAFCNELARLTANPMLAKT